MRAIDVATDLVERPSLTPDDSGCQEIIRTYLNTLGFEIVDYSFGGTTNTWAVLKFGEGPTLAFAGHTDVVSPGDESNWRVDSEVINPFTVTEFGNRYYGRGIADMKGGIAAMLVATVEFLSEHDRAGLNGGLAFLITSDEESSGKHGTKLVSDRLKTKGVPLDFCIVGEASSVEETGDRIYIGRRGSLHLSRVVINGLLGHVAKQNGINAAEVAARIVAGAYATQWDDALHPDFGPTTFEVTELHGTSRSFDPDGNELSTGENVIPDRAELRANWRYSPATDPEKIERKLMRVADGAYKSARHGNTADPDPFEAEWWHSGAPYSTLRSGGLVKSVQQAIAARLGRDPELSTAGGTSDGRFIAPVLGAQVVELGLPGGSIHKTNESIPVHSLDELVSDYKQILKQLLVKPK